MKKLHLALLGLGLSVGLVSPVYAVVAWEPVIAFPDLPSVLAIDLDTNNAIPPAEVLSGEDGFLVKELLDTSSINNLPTIKQDGKSFLVLDNIDQLRVMDANRDGKLDFYDPAFFKLDIVTFQPNKGFTIQKLTDAQIINLNVASKPAMQFNAQKIDGHLLLGQAVKLK